MMKNKTKNQNELKQKNKNILKKLLTKQSVVCIINNAL